MAQKLSVQIALEGGKEVERQLADIGDAGQKAFQQIKQSAEEAGGFKNLKMGDVTAQLKEMGITGAASINQIKDAVRTAGKFETITAGIQSLESGFTKATESANRATAAFGLTRKELGALRAAARQIDLGPMGGQLVAFGRIGAAFGPIGIGIVAIGAALAAVTASFISFSNSINQVAASAAKLGLSVEEFDKLRTGLREAGISSEAITDGLARLKQQIDEIDTAQVAKAFQELREAATRGFGAEGTRQLELLQEAAKRTDEAGRVARQALIELGQPIPAAAGEGLKKLGIEGHKLTTVLPQVIEKLAAMPDSVERTNLAIQILGESLGIELIAALRTGSLAIEQFKASTGSLTKEQRIAAEQTRQSLNQLSVTWDKFKADIIAPVAIPLLNFLRIAVPELISVLRAFGSTIRDFVDIVSIIAALGSLGADKWNLLISVVQGAGTAIANFASSLGGIVWDAISGAGVAAWNAIIAMVQGAGTAIANFASSLGGIVWDAISGAGVAAWNAIIAVVQGAGTAIADFASSLGGIVWDAISGAGVAAWNAIIAVVQGAGTAIADFASSLGGIVWDAISGAGVAAWDAITGAIQGAGTAIANFASSLGSITWDTISGAGVAAWDAITGAIQGAIDRLLQYIGLKERSGGSGGSAQGKARGGLIGGVGSGTSDSNLAWLSRGEHVMPASVVRQPGVLAFLEALRRGGGIPGYAEGGRVITGGQPSGGGGLSGNISNWIFSIAEAINAARRGLAAAEIQIELIGQQFTDKLFPVLTAMNQTANELSRKGLARGGLLGGRGTGTSDSNLAWVSRGEYITPARAVAQPGVLAFLEALRRSGGNLRAVLDGMGRFALGGLVPRPAFAAGGMSNVTINFPGMPPISGLRASADVVDQLHRAAALAQVRSGGRKPSRYS